MIISETIYSQTNDTAYVNRLLNLAEELRSRDSDKAMEYTEQADSLSNLMNYQLGILRSKRQKGNLLMAQGALDKALEQYYEGLQIAETGNYKEESIKFLNNIGVICQEQGELGKALNYHLQSLEIAREIDDKVGIAASSNNMGIVHYKSNNIGKALEYFRYSLKIKEELSDTLGMKQSLNNIASIYLEKFSYDSALIMYNRCLILEQRGNDRNQISITENNIGQLYLMQGNFKKAMDYFSDALQNSVVSKNSRVLASIYDNMGLVNHYLKNYQKAIGYFDSCLILARKTADYENERSAYLHLSELYSDMGNYKPAYDYYKKYEMLSNRLIEETNRVNESEAIFIKQQKENQILRLEKERETKKLQISILISFLGFILLLGSGLFIFLRLRQKTQFERTLAEQQRLRFKAVMEAQEQERKRIAGDLHDSIGQLLSVVKLNMSNLEDSIDRVGQQEAQQFKESIHMVDEACNEVRNISHNLMPAALIRSGILSALRELVNRINRTNSLTITLTTNNFPERLEENLEISLYRILQEMVNNIVKHAKASVADIQLSKKDENLLVQITDDGIGLNKKVIENSSGIGWKNIYSRLSAVDGRIDIEKRRKKGSMIILTIPV